jgi:hypothetical protein
VDCFFNNDTIYFKPYKALKEIGVAEEVRQILKYFDLAFEQPKSKYLNKTKET